MGFWIGQNSTPVYLAVLFGPLVPFFQRTELPLAPACSTPLAFVCSLLCSFLIARRTGSMGKGVTSAMIVSGTTMLVSIIVSAIAFPIISGKFENILFGVSGLSLFFPLFFALLLAAVLGGITGSSLGLWRWRPARSEPAEKE